MQKKKLTLAEKIQIKKSNKIDQQIYSMKNEIGSIMTIILVENHMDEEYIKTTPTLSFPALRSKCLGSSSHPLL